MPACALALMGRLLNLDLPPGHVQGDLVRYSSWSDFA
jgi:hypothetical protein